jgi:tellurite resistance protein TehA-like permease
MGTGIVSILLHTIPYNGTWLYWISIAIFALNVILFCTFFTLSFLRYTLYPEIWGAMIRHPGQSLFLGTFPMGLATIINMLVLVCVPVMGHRAVQLVSCSTLICICIPILISTGLGFMVVRCCSIYSLLLLRSICDVSSSPWFFQIQHFLTA